MALRNRFSFLITFFVATTFILVSVFNYYVARESIRKQILYSALPLTRDNIYSEIQAVLMQPLSIASMMGNDTFLREWSLNGEKDITKVMRYLEQIKKKFDLSSTFYVSALSDDYFYPNGILKSMSKLDAHDDWFFDFLKTNRKSEVLVDTDQAYKNNLTIFINQRVEDSNKKVIGVTGVGLNIVKLSLLLKTFSDKYDKNIFLVDEHGMIVSHVDKGLIGEVSIRSLQGIRTCASDILSLRGDEPETYRYGIDGDIYHVTARYLPALRWTLIVEQSENASLKTIHDNFIRSIGVSIFAIFMLILATNVSARSYEKQIKSKQI